MWKSIRVYYYDDNKEDLLLNGVGPIFRTLRDGYGVTRQAIRRHWKFGPHLELLIDTAQTGEDRFDRELLPFIRGGLESYLEASPSTRSIDPDAYAQISRKLGAWELEPGPYEPLYPDNSIAVGPSSDKSDVLNGQEPQKALRTFYAETAGFILEGVERTKGNEAARYSLIVQLMAVTGSLFPEDGLLRGHLSYRSHVEGYVHQFRDRQAVRKQFADCNSRFGRHMLLAVRNVTEYTDSGMYIGADPLLRGWSAAAKRLYERAYDLSLDGRLNASTGHYKEIAKRLGGEAVARWDEGAENGEMSDFHRRLLHAEGKERFFQSPSFAAYRIPVNGLYALMPLFGITPHVKHLLCELISTAVERLYGTTWQELTERLVKPDKERRGIIIHEA
ncbi:lantibiotic dehydratase C-terminal domain-containing protein [Paenibacillus tarimensis]